MISFVANAILGTPQSTLKLRSYRKLHCSVSKPTIKCTLSVERSAVAPELKRDLLIQLDEPQNMNFDLYHENVLFTDPATKIRGRFLYRVSFFLSIYNSSI